LGSVRFQSRAPQRLLYFIEALTTFRKRFADKMSQTVGAPLKEEELSKVSTSILVARILLASGGVKDQTREHLERAFENHEPQSMVKDAVDKWRNKAIEGLKSLTRLLESESR
jgi:hypothetical protein